MVMDTIAKPNENATVLKVRQFIAEKGADGWDKAWEEDELFWDNGYEQKALIEALDPAQTSVMPLPPTGRALVPGCGRGYDAVFIAHKLGYTTIGMDLSPKACVAAQQYADSSPLGKQGNLPLSFVAGDFFTYDPEEKFDLIYDYTFFCAIPPALRGDWGKKMCELVKPGGYLITLAFPLDGDREGGPPYSVDLPSYAAVLGSGWEKILDKIPNEVIGTSVGRMRLVIYKKL